MKIIDRNIFNANQELNCYVCGSRIAPGQNYERIIARGYEDFNKHYKGETPCSHAPEVAAAIKDYQA